VIKIDFPKVVIIILNWNGWKDTIECLESLYQIAYPNFTAILVDNGSENDSLNQIRAYCAGDIQVESAYFHYTQKNKPIKVVEFSRIESEQKRCRFDETAKTLVGQNIILIKNEKNFGFAEGNNIGIRFAIRVLDPEYFVLLNNDTVVDKNFLNEFVNFAFKKDEVAGLNPIVYYYNDTKRIQTMGVELQKNFFNRLGIKLTKVTDFQWIKSGELDFQGNSNPIKVDSLIGCCIFIKADVIKKHGLMDELFFVYHEESDWLFRISKKGYYYYCIPQSKIWHKYSMSSKSNVFPISLYYGTRNEFLFARKNNSFQVYIIFILYFLFSQLPKLSVEYFISNRNLQKSKIICKATYDGILLSLKKYPVIK
jgi:GT2 family glycosyltransferase